MYHYQPHQHVAINMTGRTILSVVLTLSCLTALGRAVYPVDGDGFSELSARWRQEYGNVYKTIEEQMYRKEVFRDNVKHINLLNAAYSGETEFAVNKFADMTNKEFKDRILMTPRPAPVFEKSRYLRGSEKPRDLPDSFDWTSKGSVTPVKDQGDAGTCWAFSTIENIEGQWQLKGKPLTSLSVEQVVDCDAMKDPKSINADCGVFGGWPYLAYQYIAKEGGLETEADYSYCSGGGGAPGTCEVCPPSAYNWTACGPPIPYCNMTQSCYNKLDKSKFVPGLKVAGWKAIDTNETVIQEQLVNIGPLSIALNAETLQFYHKGVFKPVFCNVKNLDHAVLLVGYGTEKDVFSSKPYWKVKNSWGAKWGENGYFRINRGGGTCGINTAVTSSVLAPV